MERLKLPANRESNFMPCFISAYHYFATRLILLPVVLLSLSAMWINGAIAFDGMVTPVPESIRLFADARRSTPKTVFNLGETVWAVGTGMPVSAGQRHRRFQWITPEGTIERQSQIVADNQFDSFRIPPSAQVGTWTVKTIDQTNSGFAIATFTVRDPRPEKGAVNLSVGAFGPAQVTAGQQFSYELSVINNGPDDAQNVRLTAELASSTSFQSLIEASGWICAKPSVGDTGTITCTIAKLASGATGGFKVTAQVDENTASDANLSQSVSITSQTTELHEPDNNAVTTASIAPTVCMLSCQDDITQASEPGKNGAIINYAEPTASSDTCNSVDCNPPSGAFFPAGVTSVVCSSLAGGSCSFKVKITDAVAVMLNGPEKMILERGSDFTDPGAIAQNGNGKTFPATPSGKIDTRTLGIHTITYTANDGQNSATATRTVEVVDTTPPQIDCPANIVARLAPKMSDQTSAVSYAPAVTDRGERLLVTTKPVSGSPFQIGLTTVEATATDAAGNQQSCTFTVTVLYRFNWLLQLPNNPQEASLAQAGSDIPIKFSLSGNKGFNIFAPGYPVAGVIPCNAPEPTVEAQTAVATEHSSFGYDPSTDQYTYLWKTETAWTGTCRQLIIKLTDGTEHRANFRFR